jgi:membrane-associated phospholipid phosphatase
MLLHYRSPRLVIYYSGLFFMSIILAIVRYLLRHTFPEQHAFMRPCERSGDCSDPAHQGGMPSGHMAATLYAFTSLYVATPSLVTASLLLASGAIMGESRFRRRFHTMPQIVLGAATGILSVLAIGNLTK